MLALVARTPTRKQFPHSTVYDHNPKNILRLFFASKIIFYFSEVIFKDPPKISFKTSIKITSRGYFLYFSRLFFLPREVIFLKNSLKRKILRGRPRMSGRRRSGTSRPFPRHVFELRFSLANEGKDGKNLSSQTWPRSPRRPSPRHPRPPDTNV